MDQHDDEQNAVSKPVEPESATVNDKRMQVFIGGKPMTEALPVAVWQRKAEEEAAAKAARDNAATSDETNDQKYEEITATIGGKPAPPLPFGLVRDPDGTMRIGLVHGREKQKTEHE